ncbi:MFS transporter [Ralstonia mannitolilytica]|uniref:Inner membrane metabolite transport protein YhjE n=1 Tax=Ralstonia mannitolilytica TaxID=105219 RepID=A0AAD2AU73_9RALS|nr:MFS transporter [Ralstonia mannitolilytica]ANA33003.1 MFS transporter [Ralstonia mannitolilytica]MBY4720586.1 MHS family MFS transporter [Ralstonia mannitolilytica]CAJ0685529.1 Inner membrane metabolite transport protein YhjE [Ralstonia mannitolilytica]CAJ0692382.1 Inner membrane metabolite transport protein YhjE [Ralstonia mannitolilytica]CAJ0711073.1 Inner membrane metabolite transport protein YhjE [Ralstonia mannitolilytica]
MSSSTSSAMAAPAADPATEASRSRIVFASFIGTAIEFYDFYVYATAAALVIGPVFFPHGSATAQALSAFVTFGIAFIARPIGSFLFGHFGDRIGRKSTLVASLLVMGISTTLIGLVPGYDSIGTLAPVLLCILRFGQGIGLGGEWGGAALLATENAPQGKRAWFGMFPQLGPSVGFLASNGLFFGLALALSDEQFRSWGWRIPFLVSAVLVALGLYVRLKIAETPAFQAAIDRQERVKVPVATLLAHHWWPTLLGALAMVVCYTLFYISTVFSLSYGVGTLHFSRPSFLGLLCLAVVFMGLATPLSAWASDRFGRKPVLIVGIIAAILSGFTMAPLLGSGQTPLVALFLIIELFLMGVTFAPMGALLPELFPTNVRYTGAGVSYNLGGILGASIAPYIAQKLAEQGGLSWVGMYVSAAAVVSLFGVLCMRETRDARLM